MNPEAQLVSDNICAGSGHPPEHFVTLSANGEQQFFQGALVLVIQSRVG